MTTTAGRWAAATASVRGASHERDGRPNQDAVRVVPVRGANAGLVAAVCDGHGGERYVRSDVGSRLGVEVACDVGRRALDQLGATPTAAAVEAHLAGAVATAIVDRWQARVLEDVGRRPFTDAERARANAPLDDAPLISYGCTLLLAVLSSSWVGLLQIGDGDVTAVRDDDAESPVPDDDRLVGGETTSLCLPTAVADARVSALLDPLPEAVILTSDGYANSFASPRWRTDAGLDLRGHARRLGMDGLEARLPGWLADSATAGGDDVSMAFVHRVDAVVPAGAPTPPPAAAATARARRGRGSVVAGVLAVVCGLLAGAALGWGIGRSGRAESGSPPPATAPAVLVTTTTTPVTSTTSVTTTSVAPTTVPDVELAATDEPVLLVGDDRGLLLTFNPNQSKPAPPQSFGWLTVSGASPRLPSLAWAYDAEDGVLRFAGTQEHPPACYPAAAVQMAGFFVWVLQPDEATLMSIDQVTGKKRDDVMIEHAKPVVGLDEADGCGGDGAKGQGDE